MEGYKSSANSYEVDTIYIGGGTPSSLTPSQIKKLFGSIRNHFCISKEAEITVEVNPHSASKKILKALKQCKVNRLSIGLQSADDSELSSLSRLHTFEDFIDTYNTARKLKFSNISVDLMFGIPNQTISSLNNTLEKVIDLSPEHISLYGLKIENGTPFAEQKDSLNLPDEDTESIMYLSAIEKLNSAGYYQYEISNFAKEGYKCAHNLKYWNCEEYLGLGTAASSYFCGRRFTFINDIKRYCEVLLCDKQESLLSEYMEIPKNQIIGEYVMLRFRLNEGIILKDFASRFNNKNFEEMFGDKLKRFVDSGHVIKNENGYALTPEGFYISNYILSEILDF